MTEWRYEKLTWPEVRQAAQERKAISAAGGCYRAARPAPAD